MNNHSTFAMGPLTQSFWIIFQQNCYLFIRYTDLPPGLKFWDKKHKKTEKNVHFWNKNSQPWIKIFIFVQNKAIFSTKIVILNQNWRFWTRNIY